MPKKVLVVDDEAVIRQRMGEIIAGEGYQVFTASDGIEALEVLKHDSVDLVLTDANMPRMWGDVLVKVMNGRYGFKREEYAKKYFGGDIAAYDAFVEKHKRTPVLMMSKDQNIFGKIAKDIGALGCFPKSYDESNPFDEAQLIQTLRQYLEK